MQRTLRRAMIAVALILSVPARPVAAMLVVAPECRGAEDRSRSFSGTMSTSDGMIQAHLHGERRCSSA